MRSEKRRSLSCPGVRRGRRGLVLALVTTVLALLTTGVAGAAIPSPPLDRSAVPSPSSAITIRSGSGVYKATGCTACHGEKEGQLDSNHGIALRPVPAGIAAMSNNPYFGTFPGGSFTLPQVNWANGGLAIGQELYLFNATSTASTPYQYPRVGDQQWYMDYPWPGQEDPYGQADFTANILPGRPSILPSDAAPWWSYAAPSTAPLGILDVPAPQFARPRSTRRPTSRVR
jgi:hypothetical protein